MKGYAFFLVVLFGCVDHRDFVLADKALIPEGTAFNENTNTVYIGSIYKQKVLGIDTDGKVREVITSNNFGKFSPLGMEMDESTNTLWVNAAVASIVKHSPDAKSKTAVMAFDPTENQLIKKYVLKTDQPAMLNDLTLDNQGNVYATETLSSNIYWVERSADQLQLFFALSTFHHPNGIVYYEPLHCLFIATDEGIVKLATDSKKAELVEAGSFDPSVIDGLAIYENYFIGHQSSKVSKFYFDESISKITKVETLDEGEAFDSSTTGEIGGGFYYYIVNSQLKSGINPETKTIKPLDSLEHVIIRKKKL